jgi:Flp pilus assembly protein CpaB
MLQTANKVAVATFFIGMAGFYLYTSRLQREMRGGDPTAVLIVRGDVALGAALTDQNLGEVLVPSRYLDRRRILAQDKAKVLGVAVDEALQMGDGLLWSDLRDGSAHQRLAAKVPVGQRAYNLPPRTNPLGSMLQAGDRVDVLLERHQTSELVLERVLVLSVGGSLESSAPRPDKKGVASNTGVTVSVAPDQAAALLAAEGKGALRLVLRNPADEAERLPHLEAISPRSAVVKASNDAREIEHVR